MGRFQDINQCLNFTDDWNEGADEEWEDIYLGKKYQAPDAAKHRSKLAIMEDAYTKRWKEVIVHDKAMRYNKSRVSGSYSGPIVIGPEPKPIRNGAAIHYMCVTKGQLKTFMLHICVYGGKTNSDVKT